MLSAPLLRVAARKGTITPLFCTQEKEIELAERMIEEFAESCRSHERKAQLDNRISMIEQNYDDYKLVRGFYALLERRCTFGSQKIISNNTTTTAVDLTAFQIRKALFEESSRRGFALTEFEKSEIISSVASKLRLSTTTTTAAAAGDVIQKMMWSDLDDNLVFHDFDAIDAKTLVGWYNLSLMQTLLFSCTKMEFHVSGGLNWKRVLRKVKRLGLMYYLESRGGEENDNGSSSIVCSLEGPLSLFKLTDRYGTSLAKLLPSIVFPKDNSTWHIDAWIIRRSMDGGRRMYEFKISSKDIPPLLAVDPLLPRDDDNNALEASSSPSASLFDSAVEEKFARRFEEVAGAVGIKWKLIREPDPLIVSGGRAFIPDFMFEKHNAGKDKKVYLEIVGFWTPEYLERKLQKLRDIVGDNDVDLFIAVDEDLACSKLMSLTATSAARGASSHLPKDRLIFYKKDAVPVKPILDYLKSIDRADDERSVNDSNLKLELDSKKENDDNIIISVSEIAQKHGISAQAALRVALRDHGDKYIDIAGGQYLISKSKMQELQSLLEEGLAAAATGKFSEACSLLSKNGVPEPCHADLVAKLGYDVIWQSIDPSTAIMAKRGKGGD
jgi:uncharacterized protein